jgi:hypothetical protein
VRVGGAIADCGIEQRDKVGYSTHVTALFFFCTPVHRFASRQGGIHGMQGLLDRQRYEAVLSFPCAG